MVSLPDHGELQNVIYTNTEASQSRLIFPLKWSLLSLSASHHTFLVPRASPYLGPSLPITVHRFLFLIHSQEHVNSLLNKSQIVYAPPVVTINYRSWYSRPSQIWVLYGVFFPWSPWLYNSISLPCLLYFLPSTCHHLINILFCSFCSPRYPQCLELS